MSGAHHSLTPGNHNAEQIARRDAAIKQIRVLLGQQPRSRYDLASIIGIPSTTVYGYLRQMEQDGEAYQTERTDACGRKLWAMEGAGQMAKDRAETEHSKRAWVVPARQMGMQRHWMDVALFGPAHVTQQ